MTIKIDKDIPIPKNSYWSKWSSVVDKMEVGDSIKLANRGLVDKFTQYGRRRGFSYKTKKESEGIRVWRVK